MANQLSLNSKTKINCDIQITHRNILHNNIKYKNIITKFIFFC